MFEKELKKKMLEEEKKKAFSGLDFKNLKKDIRKSMVKNAVESLGKKYTPPKQTAKKSGASGMVYKRGQKS